MDHNVGANQLAAAQPPPAAHQDQAEVRAVVSLDQNIPVALTLDQNGTITPVRLGRLVFDVSDFDDSDDFDSDDFDSADADDFPSEDKHSDDDDVKEEDNDNGGSSQMDTDEDSDDNISSNDTDDDATGYESDASVVFLYEVITLD